MLTICLLASRSTTVSSTSSASSVSSVSSAVVVSSSSSRSSVSSTSSTTSSSSKSQSATYIYSSTSSSVVYTPTVYSTSSVIVTTQPNGVTSQETIYTVVQTTVPATTLYSTKVVTSTSSPTGIAGLQQSGSSSSSAGSLSTGAKAGIGAGIGVAAVAAGIIGALWAMRRRKRRDQISDSGRYTPSLGGGMLGGAAYQDKSSHYTQSELSSPPMREANPLDRYATPGVSSMTATHRTSLPSNSRTSDISSVSDNGQYRPGPGMAAVPEHNHLHEPVSELPEDNAAYHPHRGDTPSLYSDDGDQNPQQPYRQTSQKSTSDRAGRLELEGQHTMLQSTPSNGGQGNYRGQLTKPQGRFDPSQNF